MMSLIPCLLLLACFGRCQDCTDVDVYCVCKKKKACAFTSIVDAYLQCANVDGRTDCLIMVSDDLGLLDDCTEVDSAMSSATPGRFLTFPGENPTWACSNGTKDTLTFSSGSSHWSVEGHPSGGTFHIRNDHPGRSPIRIQSAVDVTVGPNVELLVESQTGAGVTIGGSATDAIRVVGTSFRGAVGLVWDHASSVTTQLESTISPLYVLSMLNCSFLDTGDAVRLSGLRGVRIHNTHFRPTWSHYSLRLSGCRDVRVSNCLIEIPHATSGKYYSGTHPFAISVHSPSLGQSLGSFVSYDTTFDHLTIACPEGDTGPPSLDVTPISLDCEAGTADDPWAIRLRNSLFVGKCGNSSDANALVREGDGTLSCAAGRGMADASGESYVGCVRADRGTPTGSVRIVPSSSAWTTFWGGGACPMGGGDVGMVRVVGRGEKPFPFYESLMGYDGIPLVGHVDGDAEFSVDYDMLGRFRGSFELGALVGGRSGEHPTCSDENVYCVCAEVGTGPSSNCVADNAPSALTQCAVTDGRKDCVILVHGHVDSSTTTLILSPSMDAATPGKVAPFPGELFETSKFDWLSVRIDGHHWGIGDLFHTGGSVTLGRWASFYLPGQVVSIHGGSSLGVTIGPSVTISSDSNSGGRGIWIYATQVEGLILDGIQSIGVSSLVHFENPQIGSLTGNFSRYRVIIRNWNSGTLFDTPFGSEPVEHFLIERSFFSTTMLHLPDVSNGVIQNCVFQADGGSTAMIHLENTGSGNGVDNILIQHNTFDCLTHSPAVVYLEGNSQMLDDPTNVQFINNLILGKCADAGGIVLQAGCAPGACLSGPGKLGCNRMVEEGRILQVDDHAWDNSSFVSCADSGIGRAIEIVAGAAALPFPYYEPKRAYHGEPTDLEVDLVGRNRSGILSLNQMGALGYFAESWFCVGGDHCKYSTIGAAYQACAVDEGRDDCKIFISEKLSPYWQTLEIAHSMNASKRGLITTFPGEVVHWYGKADSDPLLNISGANWDIRGGEEGGRLVFRLEADESTHPAIECSNSHSVKIGPRLDIFGVPKNPPLDAISVHGGVHGFELDDVNFASPDRLVWDNDVRFDGEGLAASDFWVHGCVFRAGLDVQSAENWVVEASYFEMDRSNEVLKLFKTKKGTVQNCIVSYRSIAISNVIELNSAATEPRVDGLLLLHNTFEMTDLSGTLSSCFLLYQGGAGPGREPVSVSLLNNLFVGEEWADSLTSRPFLCESPACSSSSCLDDSNSTLGCNRGNANATWGAILGWTDESSSCSHSGLGLSVELIQRSGDIKSYYQPRENYIGNTGTGLAFDFAESTRNWTASTMGAVVFVRTCFGFPSDSPDACSSGHGECVAVDVCSCNSGYFDSSCSSECPGGHGNASCSGHGTCDDGTDGSGVCNCSESWNGSLCDDCAGGYFDFSCSSECPGGHGNASCSGHGICDDGTDGSGVCTSCSSGYYGSSCSLCPVCGSHGTCDDGPSGVGSCNCSAGWMGSLCDSCAGGYFGVSCSACPGAPSNPCFSHGSCSDGLTGTGVCACFDDYQPPSCLQKNSGGSWVLMIVSVAVVVPLAILLVVVVLVAGVVICLLRRHRKVEEGVNVDVTTHELVENERVTSVDGQEKQQDLKVNDAEKEEQEEEGGGERVGCEDGDTMTNSSVESDVKDESEEEEGEFEVVYEELIVKDDGKEEKGEFEVVYQEGRYVIVEEGMRAKQPSSAPPQKGKDTDVQCAIAGCSVNRGMLGTSDWRSCSYPGCDRRFHKKHTFQDGARVRRRTACPEHENS